jgi:membrane protease YdiL (CAAX protease family)
VENGSGDRFAPTQLIPPAPARPDAPEVTWRWWEAIVVFLVGTVLGGLIVLPAAQAVGSSRLEDLITGLGGEVGLGAAVAGWLLLMHRRNVRALGVPRRPFLEVGVGIVGGLIVYVGGVFVIGAVLTSLLQHASNRHVRAPHQLPTHLSSGEIVLAGITVILLAPVAEELFFRGLLFRSLRARHGFWFAGPISAVVFGAAHFQGQWQNGLLLSLVMVFVGLALAYLYELRGTIVANMAAHATFNVIGFVFIVTLNR